MQPVIAHKGKRSLRCRVHGHESAFRAGASRRQRDRDRRRDHRPCAAIARKKRARARSTRLRSALYDHPDRHDRRRHRAQHRAARMPLRFRDPRICPGDDPDAHHRRADALARACCPRCTRVSREPASRSRNATPSPRSRRPSTARWCSSPLSLTGANSVGKVELRHRRRALSAGRHPDRHLRPRLDRAGTTAGRMDRARPGAAMRDLHRRLIARVGLPPRPAARLARTASN